MSQEQRKILTAKRHGNRSTHRPQNNTPASNSTNSGVKRQHDLEETEMPPNKRPNQNISHKQNKKHVYNKCTKNLAEKRLQNLRHSLEIQRRLLEGISGSAAGTSSANVSIKLETSKSSTRSSFSSSPLQNRLKRKSTTVAVESVKSTLSNTPILKSNPNETISNKSRVEIDLTEEMDWSEIDETTVVNDIIDLRKEINYHKELPVAKQVENFVSFSSDAVFVVVDTNVFLSQLTLLTQLKEKTFKGLGRATVVVPWMVIQELDYMKESHCSGNLTKAARRAVHYINEQLANKDPHFTGQSVREAATLDMSSKNPDDGILFSCIQLAEKGKRVVLLSNDINLRNKTLVNNIQAFSSTEILDNLNNMKPTAIETPISEQSVQKIKILLSNLLTHVITNEMSEAYGEVWHKMAMMHPPFTTEEALACMLKYWVAVFSFSLQKQCKLKTEEFVGFLKGRRNDSSYHSTDFNKFVEYTLSLCIYLKNGYNKYRTLVNDCIINIQQCAER